GFTPFAEERDAEVVRETLSRYFELAREICGRYGGTIEKFIGDAVMAVWGAPTAQEDDAERAVRAALELVAEVGSVAEGVQARAGVLTGEAVVTLGARDQGMVAGDLVNTASRLQSAAPAGSVLVGETTFRAADKAIAFEPAGEQLLKGKTAPVAAYRALRVVAERGGRNRSESLEAPFVGRESELRLLKDMLHATSREGKARLVSITGIAGIGKSRLAWEFEKYLDGLVESIRWHSGRSPAYGEGVTFWALGEMVRSRAQLVEGEDERAVRARIAASVAEWVPDEQERNWIEAALLALLGVAEAPSGGREGLFAAWRTYFERIAARDTVVMVFEDLHWADAGVLDFIDHMLEWSRDLPICIVSLARPELLERRPDWGAGKRNFTSLTLSPLDGEQMRQLLAGLVPGLPERTSAAIVARAEGIPLYAVEMVRVLVAEGKLVEAEGSYRPVGDLGEIAVPETLQGLIAARLDALDPADRALLQDAAVLGQSFTPAGLAHVTGTAAEELEPRLRGLVRREVLANKVDPRSPERGQYSFVQALIREVAYNTLAKAERRARHLAAARWFESLGEEELAGALAAHYLSAYRNTLPGPEADALAVQARIALKAAGDRAVQLGSHEQATGFYDQALSVCSEMVERIDLLLRGAEAASLAGRHDEAAKRAREALESERQGEDRRSIAQAATVLGRVLLNAYRRTEALEVLEPMDAEVAELRSEPAVIALGGQLARAYFFDEQDRRSIEVAERVLEAAEHTNLVPVIADTLITKGSALNNMGRGYEAVGMVRAGLSLAQAHGLHDLILRGYVNLAGVEMAVDPRASFETARSGLAAANRLGWTAYPSLTVNFVEVALRTGEWLAALDAANRALERQLDTVDWFALAATRYQIELLMGSAERSLLGQLAETARELGAEAEVTMHNLRGWQTLVDGQLDESYGHWIAMARGSALNAPDASTMAARCA
ncbi:MAG TPA: AAA family ATPase, partial [Candidatus Limnocylindria bacterium]|nr:AAA family ATPase [Candidatus Limnocylindria bacterium]